MTDNFDLDIKMPTILVIDDDDDVLDITTRILETENYKTLKAINVAHAMALLELNWVDLIILDLCMPRKNGTYLFSFLDESYPNVKIIVYSGYNLNSHPDKELVLSRAFKFVEKGKNSKTLLEAVSSALKQ
jgi:two-component system competent response regulator ComA